MIFILQVKWQATSRQSFKAFDVIRTRTLLTSNLLLQVYVSLGSWPSIGNGKNWFYLWVSLNFLIVMFTGIIFMNSCGNICIFAGLIFFFMWWKFSCSIHKLIENIFLFFLICALLTISFLFIKEWMLLIWIVTSTAYQSVAVH